MEPLTMLFLLLSIGLVILTAYKRKQELDFLSLIMAIFSLTTTLTDDSIGTALPYLVILSTFLILIGIVKLLFPRED